MAAVIAFALVGWWIIGGASRWVTATLAAALLLPPLPLPWGNAGPHLAIALAGLGVVAGLARVVSWEIRWRPVSMALAALWFALAAEHPVRRAPFRSGGSSGVAGAGRAVFDIRLPVFLPCRRSREKAWARGS